MPIQQHPLPQDISSYKFRLIGDMTVKQFLYIAGFIILTILIQKSPIPFFFRYPLEILSLGLGIGLAFVPVQGRPLDQWIIAFIKSIYSPTQYVWKQSENEPLKTVTQKKPPSSIQTTVKPGPKTPLPQQTAKKTFSVPPKPNKQNPAVPSNSSQTISSVSFPVKQTKTAISPAKTNVRPVKTPATPTVNPTIPQPPSSQPINKTNAPPSANLPIPFTPDQPNTIVGLTLNPQGLILDGVLIEIISNGLTIRATKSNKLGQFLFAKALNNGLYQIKAEKEGFHFNTYSINLEGKIIKPLKIQAKT